MFIGDISRFCSIIVGNTNKKETFKILAPELNIISSMCFE